MPSLPMCLHSFLSISLSTVILTPAAFAQVAPSDATAKEGFRARNSEQAWELNFDTRGFTVEPDAGDWSWGLELVSYGFEGRQREMSSSEQLSAEGQRFTQTWNQGLDEWYLNGSAGLEHGFTVYERPGVSEREALVFSLRVRGDLTPKIQSGRRAVSFLTNSGREALTYSKLAVFDADERVLTAWFELHDDSLALMVDERDARYPLTVDPIAHEAYLKASNPDINDGLGQAVAVSGSMIVITALGEDSDSDTVNGNQNDNSLTDSGAAYVFHRAGSVWNQLAYLKPTFPGIGDKFGTSVSISGDTIVVGAEREDSNAVGIGGNGKDDTAPVSGAVYVFVRNGASWSQQAYIKASNTGDGDRFGASVSIDGDTLVVGAAEEDSAATGVNGNQNDDTAPLAGAAYVFVRSGTTWTQQAYLKPSNTQAVDEFGSSVAISGDTIVIGALFEDSNATGANGDGSNNSKLNSGAAYVFVRNGLTWTQQSYLKPANTDSLDEFGGAVAISGDRIAIGARREASSATGIDSFDFDNSSPDSGAVYVFERSGIKWKQTAYIKASNTDPSDSFGTSLSLSGNILAVGADFEDSVETGLTGTGTDNSAQAAGAAYVFSITGVTWSQFSYVKATNPNSTDKFGASIAISENTMIVGAIGEDSSSTGVNGDQSDNMLFQSGAGYVYDVTPFALTSKQSTISLSAGGAQKLTLDAGTLRADDFYWMFGSVTGTTPGIDFGGGLVLPLNLDAYFLITLEKPNLGAFSNFLSQLDSNGEATAILTLPAGLDPSLAGVVMNHAYLSAEVLGFPNYASNAVSVQLIP